MVLNTNKNCILPKSFYKSIRVHCSLNTVSRSIKFKKNMKLNSTDINKKNLIFLNKQFDIQILQGS